MSAESTSKRECKSVESAFVITSEMIESAKSAESMMMDISIEVFEVTKSLVDAIIVIPKKLPREKKFKKIRAMEKKVNNLFHDIVKYKDTRYDDSVILGLAYLCIFWIHDAVIEDLSEDKEAYLIRCLELLKGKELDHIVILLATRVLNYLGNNYLNLEKPENSIPIFEKALQLYLTYTKGKDIYPVPFNILSIFNFEKNINSKNLLEEIYITVLQRLIKTNERIFQADECTCVRYKLEYFNQYVRYMPLTIGSVKFVVESASISEYFLSQNYFTAARNYLIAANWMLERFYLDRYKSSDIQLIQGEEVLKHAEYDDICNIMSKYWGKYGLALLRLSVRRLLAEQEENESFETSNLKMESSTKFHEQFNKLTLFADVGEYLQYYIHIITDKYLTYYSDVELVYNKVLIWFEKAKTYYTPDKHKIEYITIVQDISKTYKYFAYYNKDIKNLMILHLKRVVMLEQVLKILHKCDHNIHKQIWLEIAVIYSTLMDLIFQSSQANIKTHPLSLNECAILSMNHFQMYLCS